MVDIRDLIKMGWLARIIYSTLPSEEFELLRAFRSVSSAIPEQSHVLGTLKKRKSEQRSQNDLNS